MYRSHVEDIIVDLLQLWRRGQCGGAIFTKQHKLTSVLAYMYIMV